jgi:hypothetical protein
VVCVACRVPDERSLSLVRRQFTCPTCKGKGAVAAERLIVREGFLTLPGHPYVNPRDKWQVWCTGCVQQVPIRYGNIRAGHGCGGCRGYYSDPDALASWMVKRGFEPAVPFSGRLSDPWPSYCRRERHRVAPSPANLRMRLSQKCPYCVGRALAPEDALAVMAGAGWIPLDTAFPGRTVPWPCECNRCHEISSPTYKAAKRKHGCRFCDKQGFDLVGPGYLYVLRNATLRAVKPGITSERAENKSRRRALLARDDWETRHLMRFERGEQARRVEIEVLSLLTNTLGLRQALTKGQMRFNGATETFWESDIDALAVYQLAVAAARRLDLPFITAAIR